MDKQAFKNKVKDLWALIKRTAARVWAYLKVAKMEWIVMISVFALDLIAKSLVENFLDYDTTVPMIPYFLNARKVHNYNAAFGSSTLTSWIGGTGARIFFCVFAVAASVAFILILIKNRGKSRVFRISLALFVAGAMGNCIDRMILGYVRDFIEFVYFGGTIGGRTTWAYVFNIADVALVTGVCLIIFYFLVLYRDPDKKKNAEAVEAVEADGETSSDIVDDETPDGEASAGESARAESASDEGQAETAAESDEKTDEAQVETAAESDAKSDAAETADGGE